MSQKRTEIDDEEISGKQAFFVLLGIAVIIAGVVFLLNSAKFQRTVKTWQSEYNGGLDCIVNIYDTEGGLIASYEGIIDIQESDTKVLFELNGKRYSYYNRPVEVIEK